MTCKTYGILLACGAALAGCQSPDRSYDSGRDGEHAAPYAETPAPPQSENPAEPGHGPEYRDPVSSPAATPEARHESAALQSAGHSDDWGAGTMHVSASGSFFNDSNDSGGPDANNLTLQGQYGYLFTDRFEVNINGLYSNTDLGTNDNTRDGALAGLRFYVITPDEGNAADMSDFGVYAEGKAGFLHTDDGVQNDTDLAAGAGVGILWWPWGVGRGMGVEVSGDWLNTQEFDRVGAFLGLGFWW